jgi:hypothetical protein
MTLVEAILILLGAEALREIGKIAVNEIYAQVKRAARRNRK